MNLDKRIRIRNLDVLTPTRKKFRLRWKEYQILSLLVAKSPALVTRAEIIESIWKGTYCSDSTINQTIKSIRQKIDDVEHTLIRTIPRLGYKVESQSAFYFISEEDEPAVDEILGGIVNGNVQAEFSESNGEIKQGLNEEISNLQDKESSATEKSSVSSSVVKQTSGKNKTAVLCSFFTMPEIRAVKYLMVFLSLLVISYFSYILGHQTRPLVINDIRNNTRVVLTLTLNDSQGKSPKTLFCFYQGENLDQVTIECADPNKGRLMYEVSSSVGQGDIIPMLPHETVQYQVSYDVKN